MVFTFACRYAFAGSFLVESEFLDFQDLGVRVLGFVAHIGFGCHFCGRRQKAMATDKFCRFVVGCFMRFDR
jgi:hypothetical protein